MSGVCVGSGQTIAGFGQLSPIPPLMVGNFPLSKWYSTTNTRTNEEREKEGDERERGVQEYRGNDRSMRVFLFFFFCL